MSKPQYAGGPTPRSPAVGTHYPNDWSLVSGEDKALLQRAKKVLPTLTHLDMSWLDLGYSTFFQTGKGSRLIDKNGKVTWRPHMLPHTQRHAASAAFDPRNTRTTTTNDQLQEWIDYMCAFGPNLLGYQIPEVDAAIHAQMKRADAISGKVTRRVHPTRNDGFRGCTERRQIQ